MQVLWLMHHLDKTTKHVMFYVASSLSPCKHITQIAIDNLIGIYMYIA